MGGVTYARIVFHFVADSLCPTLFKQYLCTLDKNIKIYHDQFLQAS